MGREPDVTRHDDDTAHRHRTSSTMHDTAAQLERTEALMHAAAERSPDPETKARQHALADRITAQAKAIDRRADDLDDA
ncbi:hypothetical protein [Actinoplanes missouriensis]|uniref:hypothetical protein n=1 Tax=Actinoplanes missouriensis TaxID=1866 RepID=UPI0012F789F1|nr:hypothetical protein [Actinoplanes missouriensis]